MDFKVFRMDRINSRTPRIDSYPSRDEVSLPGLQGIDPHPSGIDSGPLCQILGVSESKLVFFPRFCEKGFMN
ncbi:hypothetical protein PIB30_029851 [Stylosanthes scabra]|uniref:Uncharacterized protein n=1 Tax=Stylosanthes scabra TaxID=79078 RepID=A0ABU6YDA3_9FABA|nr:hypothetical protein [Stylosanthes scabra]